MKQKYYQQGYGGIEWILFAGFLGILAYFFLYPLSFPKASQQGGSTATTYCREIINDVNAPTLTAPSYKGNKIDPSQTRTYRLIKKNVPITPYVWGGPLYAAVASYEHLASSYRQDYTDPKTGEKFVIRIPNGSGGRSYEFASSFNPGIANSVTFADYGILLLYHVDENDEPIEIHDLPVFAWGPPNLVDIYKAVDLPDLPEWVLQCLDDPLMNGTYTSTNKKELEFYYPNPKGSPFKKEEQLNWFLFRQDRYIAHAWWVPHCKPAVYLYPEHDETVNVKVGMPSGSFLYTDPLYPKDSGWNVLASPNGDLQYLGNTFADSKGKINHPDGILPYLYYEARIQDSAITKPTTGFVKKQAELSSFFSEILPKLGLNEKESTEFQQYWKKALPKSPYYFIGIVPQTNLDSIEPLTITPKQNTTIRVSLYFEGLSTFKVVPPPSITTPARSGFTVVEWGGMIKNDKNHPFTCVQ